jgi:hypothetical protein
MPDGTGGMGLNHAMRIICIVTCPASRFQRPASGFPL